MKVILVTPDIAERWLEANTHNRPIRQHVVDKYAAAMKRGEWRLTPEAIMFSKPYTDAEGKEVRETLINGQHRLWAVLNSGVSVEMTVWWGCEPDEFEVVDQNAVRTFGDILSTTRGDLADPTLVASVCSSFARYGIGFKTSEGVLRQAHINAMLAHIEPHILAVVDYKKRLRKLAPRSVVAALLFSHIINPGMTDMIVSQLKDAVGFTDKDPVRALHLYLSAQLAPGARDSADAQHYKTCHAIASRLKGEHIKLLRISGESLGWLRDASRSKISPVVTAIYERTPHNFYTPKILLEGKE